MAVNRAELLGKGAAADIRGMDATALAALVPAMREARREVAGELAEWLRRVGPQAINEKFTPAQLRQVQLLLGVAEGQAQNRRGSFPTAARSAVLSVMGRAEAPSRAAATVVNELAQLGARFSDMPPPQLRHAAIMARGDRMVINRYPASANRYAGQVRDDLRMQFGVGLARGESVDQLVKRISNLSTFRTAVDATNAPAAAGAMATGLTNRYHNSANRLVRTELVNAYNFTANEGIREAHRIDNRVVSRWDGSNDSRICVICRGLDGKTVTPGEDFPGGYTFPPAHPHCRCTIVAWMDDWGPGKPDPEMPPSAEQVLADEKARAKGARQEAELVRAEGQTQAIAAAPEAPTRRASRRPPQPEVTWGEPWENRTQTHMDFLTMIKSQPEAMRGSMLSTLEQNPEAVFTGQVTNGSLVKFVRNAERIDRELAALEAWRVKYDPARRVQATQERRVERARLRDEGRAKREAERAQAKEAKRQAALTAKAAKLYGSPGDVTARALATIDTTKLQPMATVAHKNHADPKKLLTDSAGEPSYQKRNFEYAMHALTGKKITFEEITHGFAVPDGFRAELQNIGRDGRNPTLTWDIIDVKTGKIAAIGFERDFSQRKGKVNVHHAYLVVGHEYQSSGVSDTINGNALRHYEKWGIETANVDAAWVGRYAWPRLGFSFDSPQEILNSTANFIDKHPHLQPRRAELMAEASKRVTQPGKFADWDIQGESKTRSGAAFTPSGPKVAKIAPGAMRFEDEFNTGSGKGPSGGAKQVQGYHIGQAVLMSKEAGGMIHGTLPIDRKNPGYLRAITKAKVARDP